VPFVKLDTRILNSTLWFDRSIRDVFITALLMAEPWVFDQPMEQVEARTLKKTGFVVPPGWYGFIPTSGIGIIRQSLVDTDPGYAALDALGSADDESRSHDFEGRRLVRVDGGFVVLNYMKFRDRDENGARRQKLYRERQKRLEENAKREEMAEKEAASRVTSVTSRVTVTEAEEEVEEETTTTTSEAALPDQKRKSNLSPSRESDEPLLFPSTSSEVPTVPVTRAQGKRAKVKSELDAAVDECEAYFKTVFNKRTNFKLDKKQRAMGIEGLKAAMELAVDRGATEEKKLGSAVDLIKEAINRMAIDEFHNGKNDSHIKHLDWEHLFRGAKKPCPRKLTEYWLNDDRDA
jgi:hypothetical protein